MIEKVMLFPKIQRIDDKFKRTVVTEKLDGSNLGFFKDKGDLIIAQRKLIYKLKDIDNNKNVMLKDLYTWLKEYGHDLQDKLNDQSGFFGEWLGQGYLKYSNFTHNLFIFAKANINNMEIDNLQFDHNLFIYPFANQDIPSYIDKVPVVKVFDYIPFINELDELYDSYLKEKERPVEGFVLNNNNNIYKYVRNKRGRVIPHEIREK